jgi:uncharacterized protein (DUF3084 family)
MASKDELQSTLKAKFSINKNISQFLSREECEELLSLLVREPSAVKIVQSYADKNNSLGRNNATYARSSNQAKQKLEALKIEYFQLEESIKSMEDAKETLENRKSVLGEEQRRLEAQIQSLSSENKTLASNAQKLTTQNDELLEANAQLKKENKDLKNIVDQIRLRLARDTKLLLQYEDSEIRKALIRLFRWTLG